VFDSGFNDWFGFLCGTGQLQSAGCASLRRDPSDLNVASIAIGDLAGRQTVRRTVTNVSGRTETYTATLTGLSGVTATVEPATFTIAPGASTTISVSFTRTTAPANAYAGGQVTWTGSMGHVVRIPVVVRPVALAAPAQVSGDGAPLRYNVTFGFDGPFTATPRGLIPATRTDGVVQDDPTNEFVKDGPGTTFFDVSIPAGTSYARFSLFDEFTDGNDDLDLYVYNEAGTLVASSGGGTSAEEANLVDPAAGTYRVYVHGWQTDGPDAAFTLFSWLLGTTSAGNMSVTAPASAVLGTVGEISLSFTGLTPGTKYLGSVAYGGAAGLPRPTIVRIDAR
jgi:hypothetical protein